MSSGFLLLNQHEHISYANPSALRLLSVDLGDLATDDTFDVRKHLLSLAVDPAVARVELENLWSHPEQEYTSDLALAKAAVRWLRVRSFPVQDTTGRLLGRGVLFDDVTLEYAAAEERDEKLALAAHELKTPLAIIKGCATTLLGGSARWDHAMQREMLQMIDTQADQLHDVLNTLLDVWRLDAGVQLHLSQVHLPTLLQHIIERRRKTTPTHHFTLHTAYETVEVTCDIMRVEQVVHHVLNNAVRYSPANSTITLHVEANEIEVRIAISDEGTGIAPEHLDRIFERFYRIQQGEENAHTSGLGLAAARATIEAHGGRIWADSAGVGHGSTIYFTLPFTPRSLALAQNISTTQGNSTPAVKQAMPFKQDRRTRVLLAEGDPRMTRYLRSNLEEQRYRVQTVNQSVQFLRQLDLEEPDVVLLATRLADMSGIELLQRLREFSQAPVIMLADHCDEDERVQLFDLGSDDVVVKPFGMKELLARIRAILRRQPAATSQAIKQTIFTTGELMIDYSQHLVMLRGQPIQLSHTEYKLLSVLAQNAGMVVTHELLLEKVWGPEYSRDIDFIWVYISRLRRKIEADSRRPRYILTVPDVGYKLAKS
ncbi:MAG: winged helix-turn-helix domain-containing protein [Ktedonobacteraceae bacterium]|nr:winged helix-turn-helix domain-containing protein [Ktedonobacteraceae bacterium]